MLLSSEFPNFLEERKALTGVYIGVKDYGVKPIDEENEDEKAHLDTENEKLINFIGYSTSQEKIMKGICTKAIKKSMVFFEFHFVKNRQDTLCKGRRKRNCCRIQGS